MHANHAISDAYNHTWWDEDASFAYTSLRYCVNPVRYGYFRRCLQQHNLQGKAVLDIGCGGGYLSEEFAKDGFEVTGIDPSENSVQAARRHAAQSKLAIDYRIGRGESLPFEDGRFDLIACCDVLEHVDDVNQVVSEVSRTLKTGGVFLYDTVNRTLKSKIVLIKVWQDWGLVRDLSPNAHTWEKFIRPDELTAIMDRYGLANQNTKGITAKQNPFVVVRALLKLRRGQIPNDAINTVLGLRETGDLSVSYMGYAIKTRKEQ